MRDTIKANTMIDRVQADKDKNKRLYKAQADEHKGQLLANDIITRADSLLQSEDRGKVDFNDIDDVKTRTYSYLKACAISEAYPSVMGLAVDAYGISRQALNQYLLRNPTSEATEFIQKAKDVIADILTNASLYNNANAVAVIFQLKNHFEHSDRVEIQPLRVSDPVDNLSVEEIAQRYMLDITEGEDYPES